jgi:hypothetical protein
LRRTDQWMLSPDGAAVRLSFSGPGEFERWDPVTGERRKLPTNGQTVRIEFGPWDAFFLVRVPQSNAPAEEGAREERVVSVPASGWKFTTEQPVFVPYAADAAGKPVWLAAERLSNRSWWLAGPFPYDDHRGFYTEYAPEKDKTPGGEGWTWYESPTYTVALRDGLKVPRDREAGVYYAAAYVYSPSIRRAEIVTAFADGMKAWINGEQVLSVHRHPKWLLMRDSWAERRAVALRKGWNRVLLKIEPSLMVPTAFLFRLTDTSGRTLRDITWSAKPEGAPAAPAGATQLELEVPAGSGMFVIPAFERPFRVSVDGRELTGIKPGSQAPVQAGSQIRFEFQTADIPECAIEFRPGQTTSNLFRWTNSPLAHYSGSASYIRDVDVPAVQPGERLWLDLGAVGTAAQLFVNGKSGGRRAWRPFRFDITSLVHPGRNTIRVLVANSDAGWQSQGDTIYPRGSWGLRYQTELDRLPTIVPNGLEGPVRIIVASPVQRPAPPAKAAARR